ISRSPTADDRGQTMEDGRRAHLAFLLHPSSVVRPSSSDHVGQQAEKARTLDGARELALFLGGHGGDAARHDLAALGYVALQEPHVLVVDLGRVRPRKRTGLAAAEERPA